MLNQAAQKFIFMLEKITMGLGWARALCAPPPPMDPPCVGAKTPIFSRHSLV